MIIKILSLLQVYKGDIIFFYRLLFNSVQKYVFVVFDYFVQFFYGQSIYVRVWCVVRGLEEIENFRNGVLEININSFFRYIVMY